MKDKFGRLKDKFKDIFRRFIGLIKEKADCLMNWILAHFGTHKNQGLTLEQVQQKYDDLKDQRDKQMDHAQRLLGLCALSGFISLLAKPTWETVTNGVLRVLLTCCIAALLGTVVAVVLVILDDLSNPIKTPMLLDTAAQAQAPQSGTTEQESQTGAPEPGQAPQPEQPQPANEEQETPDKTQGEQESQTSTPADKQSRHTITMGHQRFAAIKGRLNTLVCFVHKADQHEQESQTGAPEPGQAPQAEQPQPQPANEKQETPDKTQGEQESQTGAPEPGQAPQPGQPQPQPANEKPKTLVDEWEEQAYQLECHNNLRKRLTYVAYAVYAVAMDGIIVCLFPL